MAHKSLLEKTYTNTTRLRRFLGSVAAGVVVAASPMLNGSAFAQGTWVVQSDYFGERNTVAQSRTTRSMALSHDGASVYTGYIQSPTGSGGTQAIRKVTSDVLATAGTDHVIFGNGMPGGTGGFGPVQGQPVYDGGATGTFEAWVGTGNTTSPRGLATDDRGFVYVALRDINTVRIYSDDLSTIVGQVLGSTSPLGVAVLNDNGTYYAYVAHGNALQRWDVTNVASPSLDAGWSAAVFSGAENLTVDDNGTVFLAGGGQVRRIAASGGSVTHSVSIANAADVAVYEDNVYVISRNNPIDSAIKVLSKSDLSSAGPDIIVPDLGAPTYPRGALAQFTAIDIAADGRIFVSEENYTAGSNGIPSYTPPVTSFNPNPGTITGRIYLDRVNVLLPPPDPVEVALNADASCYDVNDTVTVTIDLTGDGITEIVGGQFFLAYDPTVLGFLSADPGDPPFTVEIFSAHVSPFIDYAVGVSGGGPGTAGDATMAELTFTALVDDVCDVADLIEFRPNMPPTKLTDNFGGEVLPDLFDLGPITIDSTAPTFATFPSNTSVECDVSMVNIAGTHDVPDANVDPNFGNYRPFMIDTGVLYQPLEGPVSITGWVDISTLPNNSSVFAGLIAQPQYAAWLAAGFDPNDTQTSFFGFIDTAYGAFNTSNSGQLGLGQQLSFGDTTQTYVGNNLGFFIDNFTIRLESGQMVLNHNANQVSQGYQDGFNYLEWAGFGGPQPIPTDWSNGAYAFVGTFFDKLGGAPEFDLTFSQSSIPDPSVTGEPTVDDNCDSNPTLTYSDTITPGACDETFMIAREWTVTDFCGNSTSQTQTITVVDTTAPTLVNVPSNITVPADAGNCDAIVSITPPTAVDNCDANPVVTYVRSDGLALADPFPQGTTMITWTATDCTGNFSTDTTEVVVSGNNLMFVDVSLQATVESGPFTRCVEFELTDANGNVVETVSETLTFMNGQATATIEVPCGDYGDCIAARDPLHTLRSTGDLTIVGTEYDAFVDDGLRGGDLNDDGVIDILDFGTFVFQFGMSSLNANTDCNTAAPHADITGNGQVGTGDFNFIQINFLQMDDVCPVTVMAGQRGFAVQPNVTPKPRTRISVRELHELGLGHLEVADLTGDGWVGPQDIAAFAAGARPE